MEAPHRNLGLDALRGLAVIAMIQQHLGAWLTRLRGADGPLRFVLYELNMLGGLAAPAFLTIAGVGLGLERARVTAEGAAGYRRTLWRRGAALAVVAYALNWLVPVWFSPSSFYVLHTIAFTWLLVPSLPRLSPGRWTALGVLVLLAGWAAQVALHTPFTIDNTRMGDTSLPGGALRLALVEGHFPLLPWLALPFFGLAAASAWLEGRSRWMAGSALVALALSGALLLARPLFGHLPTVLARAARISFYPASTAFLLGAAGCSLLLVRASLVWGASERAPGRLSIGVALGRSSLTWFVLHVLVFRQLGFVLGLQNFLPAAGVLGVIVVVCGLCAWLARRWAEADYRGSLEWWLRQVGGAGSVGPGAPPNGPPADGSAPPPS
ncbi:MAG TPA: DUF418 domain-containing transporter [Polyangiaceae bacterium]|nr:DUF418 domain-containing transporter [Polyangiaceae bacterium]